MNGRDLFDAVLRDAKADPEVIGVVLGGSRGKGALVTERSDIDVYVIVRDAEARVRWARAYPTRHGDPVEVSVVGIAGFRAYGPDYAVAHATPLLDRGGIAELLAAKGRVDPASAAEPLDAYINAYYRSAKNARDGLGVAARLDAAESIPYFLEFVFAAFGRVRPYNKWLRWELEEHPLEPPWTAADLLPRLERVLAGDQSEQQALFRDAERLARARGFGDVVDAWEPDLAWFRGDHSFEG